MPAHASASGDGEYHRGFVLTGRKADSYLGARAEKGVREMAVSGSDHAAIFTQWFMDRSTSSHVAPDPGLTPTDAAILHAIGLAHDAGMAVTIKPQIGIRTLSWIGAAHPADLDAFWADYREMVLHYADLAEAGGAQMLVIGTEMRTLSGDEARWRPLIAEVREHFHGQLTYAANSDEYARVPFWDALDYIGVDAYFPLADPADPAPPVEDLVAAWQKRRYLGPLAATSARAGKKVIFTEIGYRGGRSTAVHPSLWDIVDVTDTQAQANAYEAFYRAVADQPWMAGFYWWEVNPDRWWAQDYNPVGKSAEQVMAAWNPIVGPARAPAPVTSAMPAPRELRLSLRGRRVRGVVTPYAHSCEGRVALLIRRRVAGSWLTPRHAAPFKPDAHGRFTRRLPGGRLLRIRATFSSSCGSSRSRWLNVSG